MNSQPVHSLLNLWVIFGTCACIKNKGLNVVHIIDWLICNQCGFQHALSAILQRVDEEMKGRCNNNNRNICIAQN